MRARIKLIFIFILILMAILAAYGLWYLKLQKTIAKFSRPPPPVTISAERVKSQNWEDYLTTVGAFSAVKGIDLRSETNGIIKEIHFQSGQTVSKDDLLFVLSDSIDQAELERQAAILRLKKIDYQRNVDLSKKSAIEQSKVDATKADLEEAQAVMEKLQAIINQKHIRAPFSGRIGIRQVSEGQYITPETALVTLQMLNPLYLNFTLPEQHLSQLKTDQEVEVKIEGFKKPVMGRITALNAKVDPSSHNIQVQASFPNDDGLLTPGLFANITVHLGTIQNVKTVLQTALTYSLYGDSVYVIIPSKNEDGSRRLTVHRRYVVAGERRGNEVAITSGLTDQDVVVTSGQLKLQDSTAVTINNSYK